MEGCKAVASVAMSRDSAGEQAAAALHPEGRAKRRGRAAAPRGAARSEGGEYGEGLQFTISAQCVCNSAYISPLQVLIRISLRPCTNLPCAT